MKKYDKSLIKHRYAKENSLFKIGKSANDFKSDILSVNLGGIVFWMMIALLSVVTELF